MRKKPPQETKPLDGKAGRNIRQAFTKFAKPKKFLSTGILGELADILMLRQLDESDIQRFIDEMEKLPEKFPENMSHEIFIQRAKNIDEEDLHIAIFGYLGLGFGIKNFAMGTNISSGTKTDVQENYFVPSFQHHMVSKSKYIYTENSIPVRFSASHIAIRFKQHLGYDLDIRGSDFFTASCHALAIAQSFNSHLTMEPRCLPMIIPHKKGLFVGYIEGAPPVSFTQNYFQARRINDDFKCDGGFAHQPLPVESVITLKTFYPLEYCTKELKYLRARMIWAFMKARFTGAMRYSLDTHVTGMSAIRNDKKHQQAAEKLFKELRTIFDSEDWRIMSEQQKKHAPGISTSALLGYCLRQESAEPS